MRYLEPQTNIHQDTYPSDALNAFGILDVSYEDTPHTIPLHLGILLSQSHTRPHHLPENQPSIAFLICGMLYLCQDTNVSLFHLKRTNVTIRNYYILVSQPYCLLVRDNQLTMLTSI